MPLLEQIGPGGEAPAMPSRSVDVHPRPLDVSIVVITWNSGKWIEACLGAITEACRGLTYETIVFDNASRDATARLVSSSVLEHVRLIRSADNRGFAGGVNAALREARGRNVFLLNPDCELEPGSMTRLMEELDRDPAAAAAAPLLLDEKGAVQRDFQLRRLPTVRSLLAELLLLNKVSPGNRYVSEHHYRDLDVAVPQQVEQPAAAALLLRGTVLAQLGSFDERFAPAWFEDVDYCRRIADAGYSIRLVPDVTATHHGGSSLTQMDVGEFLQIWYRNLFRYAQKWFSVPEVELLRWAIVAGMLLRAGAVTAGIRSGGPQGTVGSAGAYLAVAKRAFERWDTESPSS